MDMLRLEGTPGIDVALRVSARARRLTLRIAPGGQAVLTRPPRATRAEAERFARAQEPWLRRTLVAHAPLHPRAGGTLPVEGRDLPIRTGTPRLGADAVALPLGREGPAAARLLKSLARTRLAEAAGRHAAALGRPHGRLTLRDTRSRWGSCAASGALSFSWRLVMAPPEVLAYVAAHEAAHLVHMDHSRAFWGVVEGLDPDWRARRAWLRANGAALHRWRFE